MSAMTAPMGRRRTSAAICSDVGRQSSGVAAARRTGGRRSGDRERVAARARRPVGRCADDPGFERLGTEEAAGDAREEQGDVAGAEGVRSAAERGGELFAVVNELADEAEEAAGAAGLWVDGGLSG